MRFRLTCVALVFCLAAAAQIMSVAQLVSFLKSSVQQKMTDSEVSKYLKTVKLTDKLTDRTIEELLAAGIGPKTREALNGLRDRSATLSTAAAVTTPKEEGPKLPPVPSAAEQADIIREVREYALNYTKGLPNFLCTQVTRRKAAGEPGSRYARGQSEPSFQTQDTLTIRLSYFEQKEDYKLILVNNSPTTQGYQNVGGATSSGEFGSMLLQIFEPRTQASFNWDH